MDYSETLYLVYFEFALTNSSIKEIISHYSTITKELEFGYLCEIYIQNIPEIVCSISEKNHAIYQIVRLAKLSTNNLS